MRKVRLSGNARAFLQREANYLRQHSPSAAAAFLDRFREVRRNLSRFPNIGQKQQTAPVKGAMRLIVGDYIVDYDLDTNDIAITAIRHARQLDPHIEMDEDFNFEDDKDV